MKFPAVSAVRTAGGLARADVRTRAENTCGCGQPASTALYYSTNQLRNGKTDRRTRRIPLCPVHNKARDAQVSRRAAAIMRLWDCR